jgi:hypothetical protein
MFSLGAAAVGRSAWSTSNAAEGANVNVFISPQRVLGSVPPDFVGLGYEASSVARPDLLSASNRAYVYLVRNLSSQGIIRIGGDTSDFSLWSPGGPANSQPRNSVIDVASIDRLGEFLHATGWKLIWGLNLGSGDAESAADQAVAVARAAGDRLFCFQVGNEPDLFRRNGHRPQNYSYRDYHAEFLRFAKTLQKRVPDAPLAGPDVADAPDWVGSFAREEANRIKLLTAHYYRASAKDPAADITTLLNADARFLSMTKQLLDVGRSANVPYRLVEVNSFSGGGKPGVSDTFASALWGLDLMFTLGIAGGSGINWQTGLNQLGFVSSYSPIFEDEAGNLTARPLYYGIRAFCRAAKGDLIEAQNDGARMSFKSYATFERENHVRVTLINKDLSEDVVACLHVPEPFAPVTIATLSAPSVNATSEVEFLERDIASEQASFKDQQSGAGVRGGIDVRVPSAAAAVLRFSPR